MSKDQLNWKVAGFAGEGIMTTGLLFSKTCARHGWQIFDYTEYPSLIRGGHNTYQVLASKSDARSQKKQLDLLVALNKNALLFHKTEVSENSLVIYDQEDDKINISEFNLPGKSLNLPMVRLAEEAGGKRVMANNVSLGASVYLLGLDLEILDGVISDVFSKKGKEIIDLNKKAAHAGYNYAKQNSKQLFGLTKTDKQYATATGNEAIGLGAIAGGLQLYVAYPMTPSSSILHFLALKEKEAGIVVKHAEDEIGAVNMALGASFAGARVMVGTSGGGLCYMTEAFGLSGVAELPLVIVNAMRPGPALGMPTWTAQGDLQFVLTASQDEFPRFVLAPGDGQEAFQLTRKALELSEKFQTLVIILSDKYLSESRHTLDLPNTSFKNLRFGINKNPHTDETGFFPRYLDTESGISERSIPGTAGGNFIANSYEHDQYGLSTEQASLRKKQVEKRNKKLAQMSKEVPDQFFDTQENSKLTFISFGSTQGPIKMARKLLLEKGIPTNLLHLSWLWPFPKEKTAKVINDSENTLVVEGNSHGQLEKLIKQETGLSVTNNFRRYDGRPFYYEDIVEFVSKLSLN